MEPGRKKSSSSPSRTPIISRVFPVSWFSKLKQKSVGPEIKPAKKQQRRKRDFPQAGRRVARFYDDSDDDAYLRLSFRKETRTEDDNASGTNPIWYDSDYEFKVPISSFKGFGSREMEAQTRKDHKRSTKQFEGRDDSLTEAGKIEKNGGSRSRKTEQNRAKACSVKKENRIKVLEEKKKVKTKFKKREAKEQEGGDSRTVFDSCAVRKCSFNPQQDFRESMVEMIVEKRIQRPEELEELLVSYLTLNSDVYHNLIIKVFQQVWLEINRGINENNTIHPK
ncbi:hypothetical protein ABFX02_13G093000 [Erythranthe guttata]